MNVCLCRTRLPDTKSDASYVDGQKHHTSGRKNLCKVLQKKACFVAVTTDAWTSKAVKSFTSYVYCFIDDSCSLQSYILAT